MPPSQNEEDLYFVDVHLHYQPKNDPARWKRLRRALLKSQKKMNDEAQRQWLEKPLGGKSYGSIGHLPGSRVGAGDHHISSAQAKIVLEKVRDKHDVVFVTEKLDGSNVCVANIDGKIIPLIRAGYPASGSSHLQHRYFFAWVLDNISKFDFILPGMRLCGEWLAQVHSIRYPNIENPFIAFDLFKNKKDRCSWDEMQTLCIKNDIPTAFLLSKGPSCSIEEAMELLGTYGHHGAIDEAEGAVWRIERKGVCDFLGKYVRPGKKDGEYFDNIQWNWKPTKKED